MSFTASNSNSSILPKNASGYFDIDDIIATHEKVPCTVEQPLFRLGFLDQSNEGGDIATGTKLEIPFWLAKGLCSKKRQIVSVDMPKQYKETYREILQADATVVDLHKLGPYYYSFGIHLLGFGHGECDDIGHVLLLAFITRFRKIMDSYQNTLNTDTATLMSKMDETEKYLFKSGQKSMMDFVNWEWGLSSKLTVSETVAKQRKRKRDTLET